jgi:D-psicose/D-tagatose/L-ribulose 3-epimerase
MKIGMNLLLWGTEINDSLFPVLEQIKSIGFDGVEVPIFNLNSQDWHIWRDKLDELGLERLAVAINGPDANPISSSPEMRKHALENNLKAIDCAEIIGAKYLSGPFHSALGVFSGKPATKEEWQYGVNHIRTLADYAAERDIVLGVEYLNRFESYLFTCTDEMLAFVEEVNHPHCKIMFDTFHANIEEKNINEAIAKCENHLIHVQLSENDRGTLGKGHIDFESIIKTLVEINYRGMVSIEAFSMKLAAANIWRKTFDSEEQLMSDSLTYLKKFIH